MTTVTGEADSARKPRAIRSDVLRQIWINRADYLYVLPALVVMLIVIAYPIYYTVELSFFKTPPGLQLRDKTFVGLDNYLAILTSDVFWRVTLNTIIWTVASTGIAFVLGFALALALHRDFFGRGMLRAIFIIPWVISAVAASYIWKWIYHSDFGIIGVVVVQMGIVDRPPNFIDSVGTVLASLIVVNIWREFPFPSSCCVPRRSMAPRHGSASGTSPFRTCVAFPRSRSCCSRWRTSTPSSFPGS